MNVEARPALPAEEAHAIHSYFNICPESPDGRWLLFFRSTQPEGEWGEVCIAPREGGAARVLAAEVACEDAHRVACQQWIDGGAAVAFHRRNGDRFAARVVDLKGNERLLAEDRLVGWGTPGGTTVPLYGPHWDPAACRDLELVDIHSGVRTTVLTAAQVRRDHADWIGSYYGDAPVSIFFPILSPDGQRVLFKLAAPAGGSWNGKQASKRQGLFVYDLASGKFCCFRVEWGHPAWHPDSRHLVNVQNLVIDTDTGQERHLDGVPDFPMAHPSWHPDGRRYVTESGLRPFGGEPGDCGLALVDATDGSWSWQYRWHQHGGATSWRRPHPHPIFNADGSRLYFNVDDGPWTRLWVAQAR